MTQNPRNISIMSFELMVKNDTAYLPLSKNNFKNADGTWPQSYDTSLFDLDINQSNIKNVQVVAFQILKNETQPVVKPEFIKINNNTLHVPHTYKTSSGAIQNQIVTALNASDVFQKQYGDLSFPIFFHPETLVRQLNIQLLEANGQSFDISSNLPLPTQRAFQALITLKITYQDR